MNQPKGRMSLREQYRLLLNPLCVLHAAFGWLLCAPIPFLIFYGSVHMTLRRLRRQPENSLPLNHTAIS